MSGRILNLLHRALPALLFVAFVLLIVGLAAGPEIGGCVGMGREAELRKEQP